MANKQYAVVEFSDDNSVEIVPTSWLEESKEDQLEEVTVKKIWLKTGSYSTAVEKCSHIVETSNIETEDTTRTKKRAQKKPKRFLSEKDSSSSDYRTQVLQKLQDIVENQQEILAMQQQLLASTAVTVVEDGGDLLDNGPCQTVEELQLLDSELAHKDKRIRMNAAISHNAVKQSFYRVKKDCRFSNTAIDSTWQRGTVHKEGRKKESFDRKISLQLKCSWQFCGKECESVKGLLAHLKHHLQEGLEVTCPYNGCTKTFKVTSSFTSHLSRYHKQCDVLDIAQNHIVETCSDPDSVQTVQQEAHSDPGPAQDKYSENIALFFLGLQAKYLVPASTVNTIVSEMRVLQDMQHEFTMSLFSRSLHEYELYDSQLKDALKAFKFSTSNAVVTDKITVRGTCYANVMLVVLSWDAGELILGMIVCIVVKEQNIVLLVLRQKRAYLDPDLGVYELDSDPALSTMEHVREKIRSTLPALEEEQLETVITKLTDLGVTSVDDCTYLTAADLDGVLPPIRSRRLISAFYSASQSTVVESCAPNMSSFTEHVTPAVSPTATPTVTPQKFQVQWHKFSVKLMNALQEKTRPLPRERRQMIRIIIEDLMATDTRPGRSKLKQIAQELVDKHPDSFLDKCGTNVVGQGFASLVMQMENRVENVRRQYAFSTSPVERPKKKSRLSDRYGCNHTEELVGFPVQTKLINEIENKGKAITDFLMSKGITVTTDPLKLIQGRMEYLAEDPKVLLLNKDMNYLRSLGGLNPGAAVRKMLRKIALNEVLGAYSLKGKKNKQAFQDLQICNLVNNAKEIKTVYKLNLRTKRNIAEKIIKSKVKPENQTTGKRCKKNRHKTVTQDQLFQHYLIVYFFCSKQL
ncbi:hypothetical protein E1301_Tti019060 [Triplophysa tibetana]|uniref:C2H2-type domain-containing protein n=1 Tax=Triplophysa tibetana TaxID=1572043 RepID=A0A5A9NQV6_9TELE|nr:hypothetical protein E1301_Tti019060 [Triplophysa tibetana]